MAKMLKLLSAKYIGNYNDTTLYKATLNNNNVNIELEIEEQYHDNEIQNKTWKITTPTNISNRQKEEILKAISQNKPINLVDVEPKVYNKEINYNNNNNENLLEIKENVELIYNFLEIQNNTGWIDLEKLKILQDKRFVLPGETPKELQQRLDELLEKLWDALEDIPFKEKDRIEYLDGEYLDFAIDKTTKEDIWHWFDNRYSKGVHHLLYGIENDGQVVYYTEVNDRIPIDKRISNLYYYELRNCEERISIEKSVLVDFEGTLVTDTDILGDKEYIDKNELFNCYEYIMLDDSNIYDMVQESIENEEEI